MKISRRVFTTKFIVTVSLAISLVGMSLILAIGFLNRPSTDAENIDTTSEVSALPELEVSEQKVGGKNGTPVITIKATPSKLAPGATANLEWKVTDADICAASGDWSGVKNATGTQTLTGIQKTSTYSLTCTNSKGPTTVDAKIEVDASLAQSSASSSSSSTDTPTSSTPTTSDPPPSGGGGGGTSSVAPIVTFNVSPGSMNAGSTATISWSINNDASPTPTCTASGSWSGSKATSGSQNVSPGAGSYTYSLTCTNSAGSSNKSDGLTVNAVSSCGTGGSCTLAEVQPHNSSGDCWMIVDYTASGGNGTGEVFKIASGFFGSSGSHNGLPSAPSLNAGSWCGKNISSTFNSKHSGGSRSDGSHNAIWWLTNNGNSLIGPWTGS